MKKLLLILICTACISNVFAQDFEYKKDERPQSKKDDYLDMYQSSSITNHELVKALEILGMHIRKFPLKEFDKKYNITVTIAEYEAGKEINSKEAFKFNNTYVHFKDTIPAEAIMPYVDYIDQFVFYLKENENKTLLTFSTYALDGRYTLNRKQERENQSYNVRTYSKIDWELNKNIPLLVYASSWHDPNHNIERFCGVVDLSMNEEDTADLLKNSPHYYIVSYKVYE